MQTVSNTLLNALRAKKKDLVIVAEFYHEDATPPFSPDDTNCLLRVAAAGGITFLGEIYDRLLDNIGRINKRIDKQLSGLTLTLSNSTREIIDFENLYGFEGLVCVIREFDRNLSTAIEDSIIHFVGRCDAPDEFTKSSESCRLNVRQILNQTEVQIPRRTFSVTDEAGRPQSDPEFEGFIYTPRGGSVNYTERVRRGGLLGILGFKKTVTRTQSYSSHSDLQEETYVPVVLGQTQAQMITFAYIDKGTWIDFLGFWCDGHEKGIASVSNIRSVTDGMTLGSIAAKLGKKGGYVDDANTQSNDDPGWIASGIYSRTAYTRGNAFGTTIESDDPAPTVVALLVGQVLPVPDETGAWVNFDASDNAVAQSRWLLGSEYYFNLSAEWLSDADDHEAYLYNEHILIDKENTDTVLLANSQNGIAGTDYNIYSSTGKISPNYWAYLSGLITYDQYLQQEAEYNFYTNPPYNSDDRTGSGVPSLPATSYRRRYTSNLILNSPMKALDFLFDIVLASSNLYLVQKSDGTIAHRHKKPVDFTFIRTANTAAATEIHVNNIMPWIGKNTLILIGANLNTSEVRRVADHRFDTAVSIAISASGGVSSSGANLSGGSSTTAPNATLTVSSATGTKTVTIAGFTLTYVPKASDTTKTVAGMLAGIINSHNELNKFIKATWTPDTSTVLVQSRIGYLELDNALENVHNAKISDPSSPPSLTALSGGTLPAGKYQVCYSYSTTEGETLTSPITEITLTANQKIQTPTITKPSRVLAVKWYCSVETNGVRRKLVNINDGSSFVIDALPKLDDQLEPAFNNTAAEVHHIALAFTDKANTQTNLTSSNMLAGTFTFPKGGKASAVNQVKLSFRDASADWKLTKLIVNDYVKQNKTKKKSPLEINGSAIDNEHQARRIANSRLAELSDGNRFYGLSSDNEAILLEEGDVICVTDESGRFVNEPCRIEEISIDSSKGYTTASFVARKYRRYYYDDQIQERLVPLPIVQNSAINTEQNTPTITQNSTATNTQVDIKITNFTQNARYRKIEMSANPDMSGATVFPIIDAVLQANGVLPEIETITKSSDASAVTRYFRVSHSSNNQTFGNPSNVLAVTFADSGGGGGGTPPPSGDAPTNLEVEQPISGLPFDIYWTDNGATGNDVLEYAPSPGGPWTVAYLNASNPTTHEPDTDGFWYYRVSNTAVPGVYAYSVRVRWYS